MGQHKSNVGSAVQYQMDKTQARELRRLAVEVSDAVEARIMGEPGAGERIRRSTQEVQIAGMGPADYWGTQLWQPLKSVCLVMAQEMGLLPGINEQSDPITAAEVARRIGSDELLIIRIMRVLTGAGICDETGRNTYKANELSKIAASLHGQAGVKIENELLFPIAARIVPYMREHGFKQFPRRPKEIDPTQYAFGGKMMWEYFRDSPEHKEWFDTLMVENRAVNIPWFHIYPFGDELGQACSSGPDDVLLVDVGGNRGADILEFRQAHPDLPGRLVLQELPETIAAVDEASMADIELQSYDFFTPQPVKGAKAYFWRWILHNWDDESIRTFLSNTVEVMNQDSKVLIEEYVLPDVGVDIKCSSHDILMMLYHSGMERSLSQWSALMDSCGLEIVKVWTRPDTDPSILECRLKQA